MSEGRDVCPFLRIPPGKCAGATVRKSKAPHPSYAPLALILKETIIFFPPQ